MYRQYRLWSVNNNLSAAILLKTANDKNYLNNWQSNRGCKKTNENLESSCQGKFRDETLSKRAVSRKASNFISKNSFIAMEFFKQFDNHQFLSF